jgi:sugar-specific transcriptional regulator TrmB
MKRLLSQFHFSTEESMVYETLLKLGGAKVSEVAKATGLKRTSVQEYIKSIEEKGFINSAKLGN